MHSSTDPNDVLAELKQDCPTTIINGETYWVVESDLLFNEADLVDYAVRRAASAAAPPEDPNEQEKRGLLGIADGGRMVRWAKGKVLTYRVDRASFRDREEEYRAVVDAAAQAARDWERACNVRFQHLSEFDAGVPAGAAGPLFDLRRDWTPGNLLALAFFPNSAANQRHIFVYEGFFNAKVNPYGKVGVLRHELGHVLGFRHEHIRAEASPSCKRGLLREDASGVIDITPFDRQSVMHYICPGMRITQAEWKLSDYDRRGAQVLYGLPDGSNPPSDHLMKYIP